MYGQDHTLFGTGWVQVTAGEHHACGLCDTGEVEGWQSANVYETRGRVAEDAPTTGSWAAVAVGAGVACALSTDGDVEYWGYQGDAGEDEVPDPPE